MCQIPNFRCRAPSRTRTRSTIGRLRRASIELRQRNKRRTRIIAKYPPAAACHHFCPPFATRCKYVARQPHLFLVHSKFAFISDSAHFESESFCRSANVFCFSSQADCYDINLIGLVHLYKCIFIGQYRCNIVSAFNCKSSSVATITAFHFLVLIVQSSMVSCKFPQQRFQCKFSAFTVNLFLVRSEIKRFRLIVFRCCSNKRKRFPFENCVNRRIKCFFSYFRSPFADSSTSPPFFRLVSHLTARQSNRNKLGYG